MNTSDMLGKRVMVVINEIQEGGKYGPITYIGTLKKIEGNIITLFALVNCTGNKWELVTGEMMVNINAKSFVSINEIES
jgi:hypothetical protein